MKSICGCGLSSTTREMLVMFSTSQCIPDGGQLSCLPFGHLCRADWSTYASLQIAFG